MTKSVFGEQPLTPDEIRMYQELCVIEHLAQQYQTMASKYLEQAARSGYEFWDHVRKHHQVPKTPATMQLNAERTAVYYEPIKRHIQRTILLQPKNQDQIKYVRPKP